MHLSRFRNNSWQGGGYSAVVPFDESRYKIYGQKMKGDKVENHMDNKHQLLLLVTSGKDYKFSNGSLYTAI